MKKTIGILGGMGPLATADLFRKITLLTDASCDNDHIRYEAGDLLYHLMVTLERYGVGLDELAGELRARMR